MKAKGEIPFTRTEKEPDFIFGNFIPIEDVAHNAGKLPVLK